MFGFLFVWFFCFLIILWLDCTVLNYESCRWQCLLILRLDTHACKWVQKMAPPPPCILVLGPALCKPRFILNLARFLCWLELHGSLGLKDLMMSTSINQERSGTLSLRRCLNQNEVFFPWNTQKDTQDLGTLTSVLEVGPGKKLILRMSDLRRSYLGKIRPLVSWLGEARPAAVTHGR